MWSGGRIHIHRDSTIRRLLDGAGLRNRGGRACIPTTDGRPRPIYSVPEGSDSLKQVLTSGHCGTAKTTFRSLQRIGQVETGSDMGGGRRIRCDAAQRRHSRFAGPALASLGLLRSLGGQCSCKVRAVVRDAYLLQAGIPDPRPSS